MEIFSKVDFEALLKPRLYTSLNIIQEVMGVPMVAVQSLARTAGLDVADDESECIGENSLGIFADAYVRKMKAYFIRAKRNASWLGPDELSIFNDFHRTFKKPECISEYAETWDDIDTDAIRESFLVQIEELSEKKSIADLLAGCGGIDFVCSEPAYQAFSFCNVRSQRLTDMQTDVLKRVTQSCLYNTRLKVKKHAVSSKQKCGAWYIFVPAHYYIYSDDDHHETDIVSENNGPYAQFINSTLRMAS